MFAQAPPDPQAALAQMVAQAQQSHQQSTHPVHAGMARAQAIGSIHQIAQALAAQIARQKAPLGKARVATTDIGGMMQNPAYAPANHSPVDGGYDWNTRSFPQPLDPAIAAALAARSRVDGGYNGGWAIPGVSRQGFAGNNG